MSRVPVATYTSRTEADVVAARLASEGIAAVVVTDSAGGFEPQLEMVRGVRVLVHESELDYARSVLDLDLDSDSDPDLIEEMAPAPAWIQKVVWFMVAVVLIGVISGLLRWFG